MRIAAMAICLATIATAAAALTPEEEWKAGIADQNKGYAVVQHAMLKIQDSV